MGAAVWSPDQINPMKADLCYKPEDYYYSSAKFYLDRLVVRADGAPQFNPRSDLRCRPLSPTTERSCFRHTLTQAEIPNRSPGRIYKHGVCHACYCILWHSIYCYSPAWFLFIRSISKPKRLLNEAFSTMEYNKLKQVINLH